MGKQLRISLIGPGDPEFYYQNIQGISKEKLNSEIKKIAKSLLESKVEIELLPDKGISFEIAKIYKKEGGKKVIGAVPQDDKTFGIKHLQEYIEAKTNNKKIFDEIINSGDWFKHDLIKGLFGDIVLYLGTSPGTDGELSYATYLYKLFKNFKTNVNIARKKVHPEIRAGKNIPYTYLVYSPFIKAKKLPEETEKYLEKFGINLIYVKNAKELKENLIKLNN